MNTDTERLDNVLRMFREEVAPNAPDVPLIDTAEAGAISASPLHATPTQLLAHPRLTFYQVKAAMDAGDLLLIDCRGKAERDVSAIPGSVTLDDVLAKPEAFKEKKGTVVTACAVGGRALGGAKRVAQALNCEVRAYSGSIIAWCHE
ncbi:unnamed protein product [Chrysoparadoxa australica]